MKQASFLFLVTAVFLLAACSDKPAEPISLKGKTMGTTYSITISQPEKSLQAPVLQKDIDELLVEVNRQMSTWQPDSEISQFNQSPLNEWMTVSPEFIEVIQLSQRLSEQSAGQFDITIGPLIELWGFGKRENESVPPDSEVVAAKAKVGWQNLQVDASGNKILKTIPLTLNVSAVAKGYGVDKVAEYLDGQTAEHYLVEIGGEMRLKGVSPKQQPWRIGIETPSLLQKNAQKVIALSDRGIATSGDYRNYFEEDGVRYSHTINPQTGYPVRHSIASVTVIADTAAEADGYATALNVMGFDAALALAESEGLAAYFILYNNEAGEGESRYRLAYSSAFEPFVGE